SGSFVLLILGAYTTIISAVSNLNIALLIPVGMGVAVGFIISSKVISYLLKRYPATMYAVIIGLVFGSVFIIFPGFEAGLTQGLISLVTMIAGFAAATYLGSHDHKDENEL
ncbi:MAG: undecaprenyl phosphate translocase family protein, partial [Culicoidibacterales bacterium]